MMSARRQCHGQSLYFIPAISSNISVSMQHAGPTELFMISLCWFTCYSDTDGLQRAMYIRLQENNVSGSNLSPNSIKWEGFSITA